MRPMCLDLDSRYGHQTLWGFYSSLGRNRYYSGSRPSTSNPIGIEKLATGVGEIIDVTVQTAPLKGAAEGRRVGRNRRVPTTRGHVGADEPTIGVGAKTATAALAAMLKGVLGKERTASV